MIKKIEALKGVNKLSKEECQTINGGVLSPCRLECLTDFADCRESGYSHCFTSLRVCKTLC